MFTRLTLKFFAVFLLIYLFLLLPGLVWPAYYDSPLGLLAALPYLSIYLFHGIGIPFLLQNDGACGWGWRAPTPFGWVFLLSFWLVLVWLCAAFVTSLSGEKPK
ncbi:MAG TPA: hypothetical protein VF338_01915 [Leptolinea sp.]